MSLLFDVLPLELRYELLLYLPVSDMRFIHSITCFYKLLRMDNRSRHYYALNGSVNNRIPLSLLDDKDIKYLKYMAGQKHCGIKLIIPAIKRNYIDIVIYLKTTNRIHPPSIATCEREAAKRGNIQIFELLQSLYRTQWHFYDSYVRIAADYKQWYFVEYYIHKTAYRIVVDEHGIKSLKNAMY